ncbi:hypothetical protein [Spirosoma pomorum]
MDSTLKKRVVRLDSGVVYLSADRIETAGRQGAAPCHSRATNTGDSFSLPASFFEKQNRKRLIISDKRCVDAPVGLN